MVRYDGHYSNVPLGIWKNTGSGRLDNLHPGTGMPHFTPPDYGHNILGVNTT